MSAGRTTAALRTSAVIALGAFALHQIRYLAGDSEGGHGYLEALVPVLVVLAASTTAGTMAAALLNGRATARKSLGWPASAGVLLSIFILQESAEGVPSAGHPGGVAHLLGDRGWIAIPLAVVIGRLVSLLLSGLVSMERKLAAPRPRRRRAPGALGRPRMAQARALVREPLGFGLARRPPPGLIG